MTEFHKVTIIGENEERYLNDILIELDYYKEPFKFEFEGCIFTASPEDANEYIREYGHDNYSQSASSGAKSLEALKRFCYSTCVLEWENK